MKNVIILFLATNILTSYTHAQQSNKTLNCELTSRVSEGAGDMPVMKSLGSDSKSLDTSLPSILIKGGNKTEGWFMVEITPKSNFGSFASIIVKDVATNRVSKVTLVGLDLTNPNLMLSADLAQGDQGSAGELVLTCQ